MRGTQATTPKTTEKQFQAMVERLAKLLGWEAYHTHDSRRSQPGFPDLVLVHPTRGVLFAELKADAGKVRPNQERWIALLTQAGADARVWRPKDWPEIERVLRGE